MFSIPLVINHGCAGIGTSPQRLLNQSAWYRNGTDYKPWACGHLRQGQGADRASWPRGQMNTQFGLATK